MAAAARTLAAVLMVVAATVSGPAARAQEAWQTLTVAEDAFTAELPDKPKYSTVQMKSGQGFPYTMHQYLLEKGAVAYVVQTAVYPKDVNVANPQANLQGGLDNAAKNMEGGKWETVSWVKYQGLTASDAIGLRSGHAIRSFSVMRGARIVTLTYAGPPDTARSPDAERFMKSLRLKP